MKPETDMTVKDTIKKALDKIFDDNSKNKEIEENHKVNFVKDLEEIYKWDKRINQNVENKETVKTSAPTDKKSDYTYTTYHKFVMSPFEKILEQPSAEILQNHAADNRPNNLTPGQLVKLTRYGRIILSRYSNIDIHGVFYIHDILRHTLNGKKETRYEIIQNDQRLSFYDDYNVCLEALTPATKLNNQRMIEKSNQEAKNVNYEYQRYQSVYYDHSFYDNSIKIETSSNSLKDNYLKTQKVQKTALKGHKLTSMFRS